MPLTVSRPPSPACTPAWGSVPPEVLWGKQGHLPAPYPLLAHLVDTWAVADVLWERFWSDGQRGVVADAFEVDVETARLMCCAAAGLHDIGKAVPCFQFLSTVEWPEGVTVPDGAVYGDIHHSVAGAAHLVTSPVAAGVLGSWTPAVAAALAGHHGDYRGKRFGNFTPSGQPLGDAERRLAGDAGGGVAWADARDALTAVIVDAITGGSRPVPVQVLGDRSALAVHAVTGLVVAADWVASGTDFLIPARTRWVSDRPVSVDPGWVREAFAAAREHAFVVVEGSGLAQPALPAAGDLTGGFPAVFGFTPRGVQVPISAPHPVLPGSAMAVLVTAPTGEGKTEAGLWAAHQLAQRCGAKGFTVALPTMATTDAMHDRVSGHMGVVSGMSGQSHAVSLVHGLASLTRGNGPGDGTEDRATVATWLHGNRKGMLAGTVVCTVDQVLLAGLRARFGMLRLTGLVNRVLIIDEVHAYDPYMQALLQRALTWLGAFRVPVVMLSATVNRELARALLDAYAAGAEYRAGAEPAYPPEGLDVHYPGIVTYSPTCGYTSTAVPTERSWRVRVVPHLLPERPARAQVNPHLGALVRDLLTPMGAERAGVTGVIVNTVRAAQDVYDQVRPWADEHGIEVLLLHARMQVGKRRERTRRVLEVAGPGSAGVRGPVVVIGTQVLEQSLDLDFDMLISEHAPLAMLLQRAGRCWRHDRVGRPAWAGDGPVVHVLRSGSSNDRDGKREALPYTPDILHTSWLTLTRHLNEHAGVIEVPGDVQRLVDQVYTADFLTVAGADEDDVEGFWREQARDAASGQVAAMSAVPLPWAVTVRTMEHLTCPDDPETTVRTRLGGEGAYVLPVTADGRIVSWNGTAPWEMPAPDRYGRVPVEAARAVLECCIPVNDERLLTALTSAPTGGTHPCWGDDSHLARVLLLPLPLTAEGQFPDPAHQGDTPYASNLDDEKGLIL